MNLLDLYEGREPYQQAIDKLEHRRIEDLEARMDDCARRGDVEGFRKAKAERDSYFKAKELNELSPDTLKSYMGKSRWDQEEHEENYMDTPLGASKAERDDANRSIHKAKQRQKGQIRAQHDLLQKGEIDEGSMKRMMHKDAERMSREAFCKKYGEENGEFWDNVSGPLDEAGIGHDIVNKTEKMARATPPSKAGAVASTVKNAAKWLAGKGGPGKEGPTYEGAFEEGIGQKVAHGIGNVVKKVAPDWVAKQQADYTEKQRAAKQAAVDKFTSQVTKVKKTNEVVNTEYNTKQVKVFKDKSGKPIGEIGVDLDASPGNDDWYCHHYATGYNVLGFDNAAEATRELKYVHKHPEAVSEAQKKNSKKVAEEGSDLHDLGAEVMRRKARAAHPVAKDEAEALALYIADKEQADVERLADLENNLQQQIDDIKKALPSEVNEDDPDEGATVAIGQPAGATDDLEEGYQDFNKVEPYAVCLAGKPVKKFDYYEQARRFHDNWKQKLYREGDKAKADKITLLPLNLDESTGIHTKLVTVLKQRGYKGPYKLSKLPKWLASLGDVANGDDEIMVTGNDPDYDAWVVYNAYGPYAFGQEMGYQMGTAAKVIKDTVPLDEAGSPAQQAAIAIAMKKSGKKPKQVDEEQKEFLYKVVCDGYDKGNFVNKNDAIFSGQYMIYYGEKEYNKIEVKEIKTGDIIWEWHGKKTDDDVAPTEVEVDEEKTRLDPKCWKGKKIGTPKTKMKGGVRVNNCVPAESVNEDNEARDAVESAIIRRILVAHKDLLQKFGPQKVMDAAQAIADDHSDVEEIGTSDVSAYVHEVERYLAMNH